MHHIKCRQGEIAERVVVFGDPCRTKRFSTLLDSCQQVNRERCLLTYTGWYKGIEVTISSTGMGTPSAAIVSEELAALGAKCIIRAGTVGGATGWVQPGDAIVPTEAIPLDGTTKAYMRRYKMLVGNPKATPEVSEILFAHAVSRGLNAKRGTVCSNDAFYLEDRRKASIWARRGALGFEMECAAIFAIGKIREFKTGAILAVTGEAGAKRGERSLDTTAVRRAIQECTVCALEAAVSIDPTRQ